MQNVPSWKTSFAGICIKGKGRCTILEAFSLYLYMLYVMFTRLYYLMLSHISQQRVLICFGRVASERGLEELEDSLKYLCCSGWFLTCYQTYFY